MRICIIFLCILFQFFPIECKANSTSIYELYRQLTPAIFAKILLPYVNNTQDVVFLNSLLKTNDSFPELKMDAKTKEIYFQNREEKIYPTKIPFKLSLPLQITHDLEAISLLLQKSNKSKIGSYFDPISEAHAILPLVALFAAGIYVVGVIDTTQDCWRKMETLPCSEKSNIYSCAISGTIFPMILASKGVIQWIGEENFPAGNRSIHNAVYQPNSIECYESGKPKFIRFSTEKGTVEYSRFHSDENSIDVFFAKKGRGFTRIRKLEFQGKGLYCLKDGKDNQANIITEEKIIHERAWSLAQSLCKDASKKEKFLLVAQAHREKMPPTIRQANEMSNGINPSYRANPAN